MCVSFHLTMLMTRINWFPSLPFSTMRSLGKYGHPLSCSHSPSKFPRIPFPRCSIPWKCFFASKGPTPKAFFCLKTIIPIKAYLYLKTTILVIACSWKSVATIGYKSPTMVLLMKCFTIILLLVAFPFAIVVDSLATSSNHPIQHFPCFPIPST